MKLFFETSHQAGGFLLAAATGLAVAGLLDAGRCEGMLRVALDLLLLCVAGVALVVVVFLCQDQMLRLYHLLGGVAGALLYLKGFGAVKRLAVKKMAERYIRKQESTACKANE